VSDNPAVGQESPEGPARRTGDEARAALSDDKRRLLELYLQGGPETPAGPPRSGARLAAGGTHPLSFEQELVWTHSRLAPELPFYNEILTIRKVGRLDIPSLERALAELLRRHEAWRTTFDTVDGAAVQIVHRPSNVDLPVLDLSHLPDAERQRRVAAMMETEVRRPIDLVRGPTVRARLVRFAEDEHRLYLVLHQIMHDGVSVYSVLLPELATLYEAFAAGRPSSLREPVIQYGDYASVQREEHIEQALKASLEYWRQQLADAPAGLDLPTDHARPSAQSFRGRQHRFPISKGLTDSLKALGRREGVTLYVVLLSAFQLLLHRYSGQDDILVGTPTSTRRHPDVEKLLGLFLNTIVLRARVSEDQTFRSLLAAQKVVAVEGLSHADVPFHLLVRDLQPKRDRGHSPLYQVMFVLEPPMPAPPRGWEISQMEADTGVSRVDLSLQLDDRPEGLLGDIRYSTDLWEHTTIERFAEHYRMLLEGIVADPERPLSAIPMLTAADRHPGPRNDRGARPDNSFVVFETGEIAQSIPERFAKQVARHPDRVAVRTTDATWTYAALDAARRKVAGAIRAGNPSPGSRVALLLDHDGPMIAGVLGTLSSGCGYVPLDPAHPVERNRRVVADARPLVILASARNLVHARDMGTTGVTIVDVDALLRTPQEPPDVPSVATPDSLAYVLYTSGTTGRPKGVAQSHRNVLHFVAAYTNNLRLCADDRLTMLSSCGVDAAVQDIFGALLNGGTVCPIDVRAVGLRGVLDRMAQLGVTVYHSTPTLYRHLLREMSGSTGPRSVRLVVLGGEELRRADVDAHRKRFPDPCVLVNGFGLTESTVVTQYFVGGSTPVCGSSVPIGRPVQSTEVSLLSRRGVPGQVFGEIAIRSPHVAVGYWRSPALATAALVQEDATPALAPQAASGRVYRTGDMGRLLPDGNIEYRGRRDQQTKILGFRVELGEIEAALALHAGIREAAAVVREADDGDRQLIGYFVPHHEPAPSQDELRGFLRGRLPAHMIPAYIVRLERLPLTRSGKLDRLVLPDPKRVPEHDDGSPPDDLERQLAAIWAGVLGIERVGVNDDFFELGGHSLMAVQLMVSIQAELGPNLALGTLLEAPTVRRLAAVLRPELAPSTPDGRSRDAEAAQEGPVRRLWRAVRSSLNEAVRARRRR
jgi:amino acid adenylation domain-containing protein